MGEWTKVKAADGNELSVYVGRPEGEVLGGLIVVQEIFGVNRSIRDVVDGYAQQGFLAAAPAIFDRFEKDVELGYGPEDMKKAFELYPRLTPETTLPDVAAAFALVEAGVGGKGVAVLGFCYGGLTSWLSAARGPQYGFTPKCTVGYYAGGVGKVAAETLSCPAILHFGADDDHIGKDQVQAVEKAHPEVEVYLYPGVGHAFANPQRPSYDASAAALAEERTLAFLQKNFA